MWKGECMIAHHNIPLPALYRDIDKYILIDIYILCTSKNYYVFHNMVVILILLSTLPH